MASLGNRVCSLAKFRFFRNCAFIPCRLANTLPEATVEKHRKSKLAQDPEEPEPDHLEAPRDFKYVYPDFLPDPKPQYRDRIREKLEHQDMLRRRAVIKIPEFYVGSILAVVVSDPHAPGKKNRFVGICIDRSGHGLRSQFTLRNVVDGQGMEITYELYNPTIQNIEVLKLEKRLDPHLFYLRDALPEYSTIPFDFEPVPHPPGANVPINPIKVKLRPRPWHERWERQDLKGVEDLGLPERFYKRAREVAKPWEKYDLMKKYRESINDDDAAKIMGYVYKKIQEIENLREQGWKKSES